MGRFQEIEPVTPGTLITFTEDASPGSCPSCRAKVLHAWQYGQTLIYQCPNGHEIPIASIGRHSE